MYILIILLFRELFGSVNTGINFDSYDDIPVETSGVNCPKPITHFDECNFAGILQENIKVLIPHMFIHSKGTTQQGGGGGYSPKIHKLTKFT